MRKLALLVALVPAIAFAKSTTSSLESKAIAALADIAKARTALDQGNDKTGDSWLTKAKGLLTTLLQQNGATQPTAQEQTPKEPENQSALSRAESAAQKLDPSLAGKLGTKPEEQNQTGSSGALGAVSDLKSIYDKVSLAQSLLHKGNSTQAKSILDEIPTSPADALKLLHR
ncbi:MAG: hypothetical protein ACJ781_11380 [Myxococcales bacterium]